MKAQTRGVLDLLEQRGERGLSPNEAHLLLGCDRLAARIHEIKAAGLDVVTTRERHGPEGTHARYVLRRPIAEPMHGRQEAWTA